MKIQLKRSGVLDGTDAKAPSNAQLDYGELAVNYNADDPAIFLKDSNNAVIRISGEGAVGTFDGDYNNLINQPTIGNGNITINAGNGLTAAGDNATANQTGDTVRTLSAKAGNSTILVDSDGIKVVNSTIAPDWGNITNKPGYVSGASLTPGSYISGSTYNGSTAQTWNINGSSSPSNGRLAAWDSGPDLNARLFRSTYGNSSSMSGGLVYRVNNSSDNYLRTCSSNSAVRGWLDVPTRTGGNASGTWGISITGNAGYASTIAINYNNNSNSTYQMLWGSGNSVYGTSGIYCNPSSNYIYSNSIQCSDWVRTSGSSGWYSQSYGGGMNMQDTTWVRVYNSKPLYVANQIAATGNVTAYYSDIRLKEKLGDITNALDKVCSIDTLLYKHNDLAKSYGYEGDRQQIGVSAQSVKEVCPEVIDRAPFDIETHETDGTQTSKSGEDYMTVNYGRLVPLLIEAIKELKAEIKELKSESEAN